MQQRSKFGVRKERNLRMDLKGAVLVGTYYNGPEFGYS